LQPPRFAYVWKQTWKELERYEVIASERDDLSPFFTAYIHGKESLLTIFARVFA